MARRQTLERKTNTFSGAAHSFKKGVVYTLDHPGRVASATGGALYGGILGGLAGSVVAGRTGGNIGGYYGIAAGARHGWKKSEPKAHAKKSAMYYTRRQHGKTVRVRKGR